MHELPHPDAFTDLNRWLAQFHGEHHASQNGFRDCPDVVHGPQRGHRSFIKQPVHEHFRALAPGSGEAEHLEHLACTLIRKQVFHFVEEND